MKPEQELFDVIEHERSRVMTHKAWQSGQNRIYTLLELATRLRQMEISNLGGHLPVWETILGSLISWHHELPIASGPMAHDDAHEIIAAALRFTRLDNLQLSTRMGLYRVRKTGNDFVLKPRWNPAVEVADLFLEASAESVKPSGPSDIERQWVANRANNSRKSPPMQVLQAAALRARRSIEARRATKPEGSLPEAFLLGNGLTIGHAIEVLAVITGLSDLCQFAASVNHRTETTLVHLPRARFVSLLLELSPSCNSEHVDELVERLTYKPGRLPRNSPLVHLEDADIIIVCPPLISSRLIDPIVLRSAGYDTKRFGPIGHQLGRQASGWARWLATAPGVLVAEEVKMFTTQGRQAGDLDIVAVDPRDKTVLCMEIKSPIDSWALTEVGKTEQIMAAACRQLAKRRRQLEEGSASCRFPPNWPDLADFTWTWAVGLPQQLCLTPPPEPHIHVTSLRYAVSLGTPPSLTAVARALRHPTLPKEGVHFKIEKLHMTFDRFQIYSEQLAAYPESGWRPTFDK